MALRNNESTTSSKPAFEGMDEDIPAQTIKPAAEQTTKAVSVAPAANTAITSPLSSGSELKKLEWAIPASDLENLGISVFPRITVGLDGYSIDKTKELGKEIRISIISWNPVWVVTTGEQNNKEADKFVRSSYDGINLKAGEGTVADYVKMLKEVEGYNKTSVKQYAEIYANLVWTKDGGPIAADEQQIVQVSLSPMSVGQWQRYLLESALRKAKGVQETSEVTMKQEKRVNGSNTYAISIFSAK